jgi:LysM repeat protein
MPKIFTCALFFCLSSALISACTSAGVASETPALTLPLTPYQTPTQTGTPIVEIPPTVVPEPTATPYVYIVKQGDTMFSIAASLELSLDALLAANPDVDPRFLNPGTEVIIPSGSQISSTAAPALPSPTPVPVTRAGTSCYISALNELWCFLTVANEGEQTLENLIGVVDLVSESGEVIEGLEAVPPLNLLPRGMQMPLVAYLNEAPSGWVGTNSRLQSAYYVSNDSEAYLDTELEEIDVDISATGSSARVLGRVQIGGGQAEIIWVLAVAYDTTGNVVGVRKWEGSGSENEFYFFVYSLGEEIARVELLAEARP